MARNEKIKNKCKDCAERQKGDNGQLFCPHLQCIFEDSDLKLWREVGGATLIDPLEGDR